MDLNEPFEGHEHATTSLKVVLLVFAIVLVGALAYLIQATDSQTETTEEAAPKVKEQTSQTISLDETATKDWKTYTNSTYGFSFMYPADWKTTENSETAAMAEPWKKYLFYTSFTAPDASDHSGYVAVAKSTETISTLIKAEYPGSTSTNSQVNLNGVTMTKATITTATGQELFAYYRLYNDYLFALHGQVAEEGDDTVAQAVTDVIASFKFAN